MLVKKNIDKEYFSVTTLKKSLPMLNEDKIISIFCLVDDLLKQIKHKEHPLRKVSDSEVITTAIVSALYFGGHLDNAKGFMKMTKLSPQMLDKSRFCRRLHHLESLICSLFLQIGQYLKDISGAANYIVDPFPVAVCDNIRIANCKLLKGKQWRENNALCGVILWRKNAGTYH